jgi:hypothetical protein
MLGACSPVKKSKKLGAFSTRPEDWALTVIYSKKQVALRPTGEPRTGRDSGYWSFPPSGKPPPRRAAGADSQAACYLIRIQEKSSPSRGEPPKLSQI